MNTDLGSIAIRRLTGTEQFHSRGAPIGPHLLGFWQWAYSDLVSNTCRGVVAEFLVASALGLADGFRAPWHPYDLKTADGKTIEVKSASLLQRWRQARHSRVVFAVAESQAEDPETAVFAKERKRQAELYVFALLSHTDKATLDPLDVSQWKFFVLPTRTLNEKRPTALTISLAGLRTLGAKEADYVKLAGAVSESA